MRMKMSEKMRRVIAKTATSRIPITTQSRWLSVRVLKMSLTLFQTSGQLQNNGIGLAAAQSKYHPLSRKLLVWISQMGIIRRSMKILQIVLTLRIISSGMKDRWLQISLSYDVSEAPFHQLTWGVIRYYQWKKYQKERKNDRIKTSSRGIRGVVSTIKRFPVHLCMKRRGRHTLLWNQSSIWSVMYRTLRISLICVNSVSKVAHSAILLTGFMWISESHSVRSEMGDAQTSNGILKF